MNNTNAIKANEQLDVEVIYKLGLTRDEFQEFSKPKPDFPKEYISINPEMVVAKIKHDAILLNMEKVDRFAVKKGEYYLMRMINFIQLYNKDRVEPTHFFKKYYNSYNGEDLNNKSILVWVYNAAVGDLLFQQAILLEIKKKYPRVFITFAVPTHHIPFIQSWNTVDRVVSNITQVTHFLNSDYHLNFEFVIRSKSGFEENVYKNFAMRASLDNHITYPQIPPNPEYRRYWTRILNDTKFIILNFNSGNPMRIPRPLFRKELLNKLIDDDYKIIFIDKNEKEINDGINKLIRHSKNPKRCLNLSNKSVDIISSISLISLAKLVVTVDTGMVHMAAAVGVPVYGIYGPFPGHIRLSTYPNTKWIDNPDLNCSPCNEHDLSKCHNSKGGFPICYDQYDMDKMVGEIKSLI